MTFQYPQLLWLLLIPLIYVVAGRGRRSRAIRFPGAGGLRAIPGSARTRLARLIPWLKVSAIMVAVVALARPQLINTNTTVVSKGIDMAIAMDLSSSMLAVDRGAGDGTGNRLSVAKQVVSDFIAKRGGDRLAVVAFAARAYPVAPLSLDHAWLASAIERLEVGTVEDGTALGDGLLAAINRLRSSPAASRTVILVTDGRANAGIVKPPAAAAIAAALGIKVYTIGIGGNEGALFPVEDPLGGLVWRRVSADLDEPVLKEIAAATGGKYFRADNKTSLRTVFQEVDRLEKVKIEETNRRSVRELFPGLLLTAFFLAMMEQMLLAVRLGRLP
ncbi:MAG: hypothetical protein CXR30_00040 [Geobacter sp.]|nr:MAG: hypothetical protein CXR30_00040 [Geobacter sp.]